MDTEARDPDPPPSGKVRAAAADDMPVLGPLLRALRLDAGLSQAELAERAGLSVRAIADLEQGRRRSPYPQTIRQLAHGLGLSDGETRRLRQAAQQHLRRDVTRPISAFPRRPALAVASGATAGSSPPPPSPTNLTALLTSFVGREREVAEIRTLLGETRLLTLTGTGGVGKSRLALAAAQAVQPEYPDGTWLVELAALADPALVPQAVARALGVAKSPDRPPVETLVAALRLRRPLLLVLDNCEHLIDACARLVEALLDCPTLRVLATSREPLAIGGERTWRVPSLGVPDDRADWPLAAVAGSAAARLFVERAGFARPGFALMEANATAVAEVCRRLDGIPLALELAAARVAALSVEQIVARLDDRFRLLTAGRRTALPRQQTLEATLAWSHDLLTGPERVLFRRLAVFAGGWTLEAAEAVCGEVGVRGQGSGVAVGEALLGGVLEPRSPAPGLSALTPDPRPPTPADVLDLLMRLVDKSLVEIEERDGAARYRLLESMRQYAWEQLRAAGEAVASRDRHRDWCLALSEAAAPALHGPDVVRWLTRLEAEHDNLRAALDWSLTEPDGAAAGLRLAGGLWPFWAARRYHNEGRWWLERLLDQAPGQDRWRALASVGVGRLAFEQGQLPTAQAWLAEGLALSHQCADAALVAWALREQAFVAIDVEGTARARTLADMALASYRAIGDAGGMAATLITLGRLERRAGEYRRAWEVLEEALARARLVGDRWLIGDALGWLGQLAGAQGNYQRARAFGEEALAITEDLGASFAAARTRWQLGNAVLDQGDHECAAAYYAAGLAVARREADTFWPAWHMLGLGRQADLQGDSLRATAILEEALALLTIMANRSGISLGQHLLGLAVWRVGDTGRARALLHASLTASRAMDNPVSIARCLEALATIADGMGQNRTGARRAARLWGAAGAIRETTGSPLPPVDRPAFEADRQQARLVLGEERFMVAWRAGQSMTLDEAVAEALAQTAPIPVSPRSQEPAASALLVGSLDERAAGGPAVAEGEAPPMADLTRRELEVLRRIAAGRSNRDIAGDLALSVRTVERHITNLYGKIDARGRADATAFVFHHGLA